MNFQKLLGKPIVCLSKKELEALFKTSQLSALKQEMVEQGVSSDDLEEALKAKDIQRYKKLADSVGRKVARDRDDHEIFAAFNIFHPFFEEGSEICFELNSKFRKDISTISNLEDLNEFREDIFGDFIIKSKDGYRVFQLKRYRGDLSEDEMISFINKVVASYGTGLGSTNLLIILQPTDDDLDKINFESMHKKLLEAKLATQGKILIAYNENNEVSVIKQVYPELATIGIPISWASGQKPSIDPEPS